MAGLRAHSWLVVGLQLTFTSAGSLSKSFCAAPVVLTLFESFSRELIFFQAEGKLFWVKSSVCAFRGAL